LRFINLFPEAIDLMVRRCVRLPISEAIINAGQEIAAPVGPEFRHRGWHAARRDLDSLLGTSPSASTPGIPVFHHRVECQRETGGNLAET